MKTATKIKLFFVALAIALSEGVIAANPSVVVDIFQEVSANIRTANVSKLAERFDGRVELLLLNTEKTYPATQAAALTTDFFEQNKPTSYSTLHVGGKDNKHYGIGLLTTPNGRFRITIFLQVNGKDYTIQQLRIENDR
jgi:hypothetical protein